MGRKKKAVVEDTSVCVAHGPCKLCGSADNVAIYDDGHEHCFTQGCEYHTAPTDEGAVRVQPARAIRSGLIEFESKALESRRITEETCLKFSYGVGSHGGKVCQVANYFDKSGQVCGQKLRFKPKRFMALGDMKSAPLFGSQLWSSGGKSITITEGELDAMSLSQAWDNKWPVVSIPAGAGNAAKCISANIEYLESFERVVFMFDNDDAGAAAAAECAELLTPGKARIAVLPLKDASDMLVAGRSAELVTAFWNAKVYRPDGVLDGTEWLGRIRTYKVPVGIPYPFNGLNEKLLGARPGEIVVICAGTGIGKSLTAREIGANLIRQGEKVGCIFLEDQVERGGLRLLTCFADRQLFLPGNEPTQEELEGWEKEFDLSNRTATYDHWGTVNVEVISAKIRYMARALGMKWFIFDHISIMVSGDETDERRNLDMSMTKLTSLIVELNVGLFVVCHLKRPKDGKGHEDGGRTHLSDLRGTHGIGQLADIVIGQERDQQNEEKKHKSVFRVLKNRLIGDTGLAGAVKYNPATGRLSDDAIESVFEEELGEV